MYHDVGVLWDAVGVRDVLHELEAAHVDLGGTTAFWPEYPASIWHDQTGVHILGSCVTPETGSVCIAQLPAR